MLFPEDRIIQKNAERPSLPPGTQIDFEIGFLFNFASGKSTRFDLEPLLISSNSSAKEFKRISLQVEKGLAYLQPLSNELYHDLLEFSDRRLLHWMNSTGNRFIRRDNGSWAHLSVRDLFNLRKHYIYILQKLWPALTNWPHVYILKNGRFNNNMAIPAKLGRHPASLSFSVHSNKSHLVLKIIVHLNGVESGIHLAGGLLLEKDGTLYLPPEPDALSLLDKFKNGPLTFPLQEKREVFQKTIAPLLDKYPVNISSDLQVEIISPEPKPTIKLSELNESNLMIRPQFLYDDVVTDFDDMSSIVEENGGQLKIVRRQSETERTFYEYLRTLHPSFMRQRNNQYYYLPFDEVMRQSWFIKMLRKVQDEDCTVVGLNELKKFRYNANEPKFTIKASSKPDWFDLKITIQWGEQLVTLKEIRQAILRGQDTIMLEDGTLGHIPSEWIRQYGLLLQTGTENKGTLRVSKMHVTLVDDILDKIGSASVKKEIEERKRKLFEYDTIPKTPLSPEIKATLRPYQQSGFHWLQALDELAWGGCLADDMGLGKTLQTISFLRFVKDKYPGSTQLVVCPTSLIFNWENELQKFCPSLKYHTYYGIQREFDKNHFEEYDIILTTYGMVRNDLDELSAFLWQYIILDESQAIKNPDAQVTKAVRKLKAMNRIILSGTPVQNNTSDLYAQFNFLNPGLLGSREFFNREFAQPIDKYGDKERTRHLQRLVYPFTLRRTKEQVAKDLPDKTVSVLWCSMDTEQRKLYNHFRDNYRNMLLKKIDEDGLGKSGMFVLEGLLRLRQICDHPALLKNEEYNIKSSVKIEELTREVKENAGSHKLLVFSQFTEMLQLIRTEFETSGIPYCYLDGSTPLKQRKEVVTRFQEDETIRAFLVSLKAGGVGLNLTVADYVYLVDPWWNPATEQQAIDRAHRIGQTRKVFAYKMICKDTVEEKILLLQERKKMLADDLIQEDAGFVKNLTREDVEFLFG